MAVDAGWRSSLQGASREAVGLVDRPFGQVAVLFWNAVGRPVGACEAVNRRKTKRPRDAAWTSLGYIEGKEWSVLIQDSKTVGGEGDEVECRLNERSWSTGIISGEEE